VGIELEYNTNDGKNSTGAFTVYRGATLIPDSTCETTVLVDNTPIDAQLISLHYALSYKIDLYFSTDPRVIGGKGEFALFKVNIWLNYKLMVQYFPNAKDPEGRYNQKVSLNEPPSDLESDVYAHKSNSYYCPSKKKYYVVKGDANTLKASISFKYLQVQAYANQAEFMKKEICPEDQQMNDTAPVIVGGILAALIIATLITYLVYRCRLSSQELALTGEEHEHEHHHEHQPHHDHHHFHHENAYQEKQHHHVDHFKHDLASESDKENSHQLHHKRPLHEQN